MSKEEVVQLFQHYGYDTPEFSLLGTKTWARVVYVYDGDSPTIILPLLGQMYRFATRVYGIDTSEMKSKDVANKERAIKAKYRLIELITGTTSPLPLTASKKEIKAFFAQSTYLVWVECLEMDKYGRVLIKMKSTPEDSKTFADILIEEKLAYPYFGDTKLSEAQQATM